MNWTGRIKLFNLENGLYKEVKCFEPLKDFNASKMREIDKNKVIVRGWEIRSSENSKYPLFFCDLISQEAKMIKDTCIEFDIMSNKNIIIFNKENIEIFDYKKFKIISRISIPSDLELKTACLYNDNTLLFGCKDKEFVEFKLNGHELIEIDRKKLKCNRDSHIEHILKLRNGSIAVIIYSEVYILKPEE